MSEANDEFISQEEIDQWQREAFEKYGVTEEKINKKCPAKKTLLQDKDGYVKKALREAFSELLLKEMYGLTTEEILTVVTPELEN